MPSNAPRSTLRLDKATMAGVKSLADAELRSVNTQIAILLREALAARGVEIRQIKRNGSTISD